MAGAKVRGITIEIGADTSQFASSLKSLNSTVNSTKSQLRDVERLLKFNPENTELLAQKQKLLGKEIEATKKKLNELKAAEQNMKDSGVDENSEEFMALRREIIATESQLEHLNAEFNKLGSGAQAVEKAEKKVKDLGNKLKSVGSAISGIGDKMTTRVTVPIVAGFTLAANSASDLEENLNKIDVAFGDSADTVRDWSMNALTQFGLSKVAATQATSAFGALAKGVGLTEESAAEMSTTLAGLSADLASYFNVSTDDSAKALEAIFTGEAESLKKFGVVMTDTNLKQFAEDQGLVYTELSQTEKTMLRYQFVLEKTSDAQGDYARTSDGTANSVKTFKAATSDLSTTIGTQLLPVITPLIQKITEIITKFSQMSPETQKIITVIGLVVAALGPVIAIVGRLITGVGALMLFAPGLTAAIGSVLGGLLPVIGVIAAVVAVGVLLYKNWDKIKAAAQRLWQSVKVAFENLKTTIVTAWENVKAKTTESWENVKTGVTNGITNAKDAVTNVISTIKSKISSTWDAIRTKTSSAFNAIKTAITNPIQQAKNTISGIIDTVKGFFPITLGKIFDGIQLPHFKVDGGELPWGVGGKGRAPTVSVEWYRKAMQNAYMLDGASIFGAMNGRLLGGGESGRELVISYDKLAQMMGGGTTNINVVVNASPGMNERQLADMVAARIQQNVNRRRAVWA